MHVSVAYAGGAHSRCPPRSRGRTRRRRRTAAVWRRTRPARAGAGAACVHVQWPAEGIEVGGWWDRLEHPRNREPDQVRHDGHRASGDDGADVDSLRPGGSWEGPYTTKATVTMTKPPVIRWRTGCSSAARTSYRQAALHLFRDSTDGKPDPQRTGATTANVAGDSADHAAIQKPDAQGSQTNELAIQVGRDTVTFMANGQTVATQPEPRSTPSASPGCVSGTASTCTIEEFTVEQGEVVRRATGVVVGLLVAGGFRSRATHASLRDSGSHHRGDPARDSQQADHHRRCRRAVSEAHPGVQRHLRQRAAGHPRSGHDDRASAGRSTRSPR